MKQIQFKQIFFSEIRLFKQKSDVSINQVVNRFNHFLSRMLKCDLKRSISKQKVTFMNAFGSDWKLIVSIVKAHEKFKNYNLARVLGDLKSHNNEFMGEVTLIPNSSSMAFFAKEDSGK